jgi:hypothetical protein
VNVNLEHRDASNQEKALESKNKYTF